MRPCHKLSGSAPDVERDRLLSAFREELIRNQIEFREIIPPARTKVIEVIETVGGQEPLTRTEVENVSTAQLETQIKTSAKEEEGRHSLTTITPMTTISLQLVKMDTGTARLIEGTRADWQGVGHFKYADATKMAMYQIMENENVQRLKAEWERAGQATADEVSRRPCLQDAFPGIVVSLAKATAFGSNYLREWLGKGWEEKVIAVAMDTEGALPPYLRNNEDFRYPEYGLVSVAVEMAPTGEATKRQKTRNGGKEEAMANNTIGETHVSNFFLWTEADMQAFEAAFQTLFETCSVYTWGGPEVHRFRGPFITDLQATEATSRNSAMGRSLVECYNQYVALPHESFKKDRETIMKVWSQWFQGVDHYRKVRQNTRDTEEEMEQTHMEYLRRDEAGIKLCVADVLSILAIRPQLQDAHAPPEENVDA